ncbi:MAG TPA: hypothetical protein VLY46_16970 [Usitatibacter sp.]|nr:hypothetical protein [Usitatibacter sp.]
MFLGHYGVAFAAKKLAPMTSLGTLVLAAQFLDILWPNLLLLGIEKVRIVPGLTAVNPLDFVSYPISHSLAMAVLWGVLFGIVYWLVRRYRAGAVVAAACVVSHWFLDLVVHVPDLPLAPGSSVKLGLGLWQSLPATLAVELAVFAAGIAVYLRATRPADRIGRYGPWGLVIFLAAMYLASVFGPPPPDAATIAWADQGQWLIVLLAYWIDRHRSAAAALPLANRAPAL